MKLLEFCNTYLLGVAVPLCLMLAGLFFMVRLRAFPFLHPLRVLRTVVAKSRAGGISPGRALSMALALKARTSPETPPIREVSS